MVLSVEKNAIKFNAYGRVPLAPSAALPGAHFPSLRRHATASPLLRFGMGHRTMAVNFKRKKPDKKSKR